MIIPKSAWTYFAVLTMAMVIPACGDHKKPELTQAQIDFNMIYLGKEGVTKRMKDPGSTEFRNVFVSRSSGSAAVCGEVNSKNSFGGYVGFQRFISAGESASFLETDMKRGEMDKSWQQFCGN